MSDSWKGEHLIRGVRLTKEERSVENSKHTNGLRKRLGRSGRTLEERQSHGRLVGSCIRRLRKIESTM